MDKEGLLQKDPVIGAMFEAGAHFGYAKSRRHPSALPYIFGSKNHIEIFDLEKTKGLLAAAKEFAAGLGTAGKTLLFVSSKNEALPAIKSAGEYIGMPYVAGRWIGGTLTNFPVIRGRVEKLINLSNDREKGELSKYTKKERLLIDREIERLERFFGGIRNMTRRPDALLVVDPRLEHTAVREANRLSIPVTALLGSDCDSASIAYPIFGNDSVQKSIAFFVREIAEAYADGKKKAA